ncbi:Rossmann fold domain-containing protein [Aurantiacibacter gangjinensis]|uniref:Short chain dehydrogenase-like proteobacteria domain-containing protein n=1 Tax=Aurantiacibacter gangjinensis TaxID=502682 RepID=A0A0G9MN74_9SPHN|nr:hypothetical protein [Aurantiacibacter gangjinensis]APE28209.1 hypothetical protein BMF35_a1380 [Aurantiacibacter gangjinensis]KLE32109.1 hypothetical protein AAW01_11925 [Aurantiacibacter gangjinensis]
MALVRIVARDLPDTPLDAAAAFHSRIVPQVRRQSGADIAVLLDHADHAHDSWRKAAIEELAREAAPCRLNAVIGPDGEACDAVCAFLDSAPGVTAQLFTTDDAA